MICRKIPFPEMEWARGGHPLEKKKSDPPVTLLAFAPGFEDPEWCVRGHVGYVLRGELTFLLDDRSETVRTGEGFVLDPGTRHRAANQGEDEVLLFIHSH